MHNFLSFKRQFKQQYAVNGIIQQWLEGNANVFGLTGCGILNNAFAKIDIANAMNTVKNILNTALLFFLYSITKNGRNVNTIIK